jgi:hypothetical protein
MKVGEVYLKTGGLGGVGTLEEYRLRGYSRRVIEFSIDYMVRNGYNVSMLFGIPDYYFRWGYALTLPIFKITMPLRNAERARPGLKARPMVKEDADAVLDLYESSNKSRTGPLKRYRGEWFRFKKGSGWVCPQTARATLDISDSGVSLSESKSTNWIEFPQWVLMQLILGYRNPKNVLIDQHVKHEGRIGEALGILFPAGNPYIWLSDWF